MDITVGVLALQGAYHKHISILSRLGIHSQLVRNSAELKKCSALILPGGESTTINILLQENALHEAVQNFAGKHPVMGVCAGMIMMAKDVDDERITPLALMPFKALRNVYGPQVHSFTAEIKLHFDSKTYKAPFIRAPGFTNLSPEIKILATHNDEVVMITSGKHIALSFHPELTGDARIHEYWINEINHIGK